MDTDTIYHFTITCAKPKGLGYPKESKTLGEHIRKRRMDLGLMQKEVAPRLGATVACVINWEKGHSEPVLRYVPAILAFLGYDPRPKPLTMVERLIAYRGSRGWRREMLAEALNVDPSTLARWETGEKEPWGDYAVRVNALLSQTS